MRAINELTTPWQSLVVLICLPGCSDELMNFLLLNRLFLLVEDKVESAGGVETAANFINDF
jgi:hypothetical protein